MTEIIDVGTNSIKTASLDGKRLNVNTTFFDDLALAKNRKIKDEQLLDRCKLKLHDDEDLRLVVSCPSYEQWSLFKLKNPDVYALLTTRGGSVDADNSRMKGARQLAILEPEWVVQERL